MIVVDTNIIAYLVIEGEKTQLARDLFNADASWRVPMLWRHEFLNVLATYERQNGLPLVECISLFNKTLDFISPYEHAVDLSLALTLASTFHISAYDAQYIALAQSLNALLITEDRKLRSAAPHIAKSMQEYLPL